jgi:choline dehydrogenase-like flavoprotein
MPADTTFDAIVVGSGISGGWAAKELTEKGLRVALLERGRHIEHIKDYKNATKAPWEYPHRGRATQAMQADYPAIRDHWSLNETNLDYWAVDKDEPYTTGRRFQWIRGYHTGGRSLMWGRYSLRWNEMDFEANAREGIAIDWPIRYKDLAPWYDYVETHAGISGSLEGLPELPDGKFLPPMDLSCGEQMVSDRLKTRFDGKRKLIRPRIANATRALKGRGACQTRNACWLGCPLGGYFSTQSSTLPAARATGRLTLINNAIASEILYNKDTKRATGVRVIDALTSAVTDYSAKIIFVCASTLNSAWLLMRSATDVWPDGLGSSSGELGHNVMDHHLNVGAGGRLDGFEDKYTYGRRPQGSYIPRFRNLFGDKRDYLRGFGYQLNSDRNGWARGIAELGVGAAFKDAMTLPGSWSIGGSGFGEILPNHNNTAKLDPTVKDKWGLPVLKLDAALSDNELRMRKDIANDFAEMLTECGVKDVSTYDTPFVMGQGIHEMGTARMGRDPKTSVLNGTNQVWDALNVFVTDGACMTSSSCVNPSLTYMALTARAADHAVNELTRRNL